MKTTNITLALFIVTFLFVEQKIMASEEAALIERVCQENNGNALFFAIWMRPSQKSTTWNYDKKNITKAFSGFKNIFETPEFAKDESPVGQALFHHLSSLPHKNSVECLIQANGFQQAQLIGQHMNPSSWQDDPRRRTKIFTLQIRPTNQENGAWQESINDYKKLVTIAAHLNSNDDTSRKAALHQATDIITKTLRNHSTGKIIVSAGVADIPPHKNRKK